MVTANVWLVGGEWIHFFKGTRQLDSCADGRTVVAQAEIIRLTEDAVRADTEECRVCLDAVASYPGAY